MSIEVFKEARRLHALGLAVHWLHPKSKRPVESGWTTGPRATWARLEKTYRSGMNVGVRLGVASKLGNGYLAGIDLDIKSTEEHHKNEAMAAVKGVIGDGYYLPMVISGRGNGSRHYYCVTTEPQKPFLARQSTDRVKVLMPSVSPSKSSTLNLTQSEVAAGYRWRPAWEISIMGEGQQIVLPPSVHPDSGKEYTWEEPLTDTALLPVLDFLAVKPQSKAGQKTGGQKDTARDFKVVPVDLAWLDISDELRSAITEGTGVEDRSAFLIRACEGLLSAGLNQNEILSVLTDSTLFMGKIGYDHAKTESRSRSAAWIYRYTLREVLERRDATRVFSAIAEIVPNTKLSDEAREGQDAEIREGMSWHDELDKTAKGQAKCTLKNLDLIFTHSVEGVAFKKDLFAQRIAYGMATPWGGKAGDYINDIDMILVKRWLGGGEFNIEPATNAILEATALVAHRMAVHPVREWLDSLTWDGKPRIATWIRDYCQGEAEEPYLSEVSRKFLLAMVKRVFEPGCQWDYVLVLEGKQGKYKSSIARALAGDKWFMDNLPDLKDKDAMLNLQGKWLIELGELTNVKRSDHNLVKAYLVRRTDTVRPHYGRLMSDVPRQSVFIGTVNEGEYLKDPTGNRRYWPVKVGLCDVKGLTAVRDQLFAEAYHIYKTENEVLMLGEEANKQAHEAQEDRRIDDDESQMREVFVEYQSSPESEDLDFDKFRIKELFSGPWLKWSANNYAVQTGAQVLRNLGFERRKVHGQRYWKRPRNTPKTGQGSHPPKLEDMEMDFF